MSAHIPDFQILALNDAEQSENRIHSDDIAQRYGFHGALVSGVNVFGYLTQPLVRSYGESWLQQGILDVIFLKPAYHDELITVTTDNLGQESSQRSHLTHATNEEGTLLARLESWLPNHLPPIQQQANMESGLAAIDRQEISWEAIHLNEPAPYYLWQPSEVDNGERVTAQRDQSAIYAGNEAYIHPYYLLDACNKALMRMFYLPAWIHTGSKLILRKGLRVGQDIEVRTLPIEKWERKGHQFIKLYIAMWEAGDVALEVEHTAIFKLAEA
ncbi:MAG: hypothetical protein MI746_02185 [Pseudomonadales bacterium]|nr:hypothetical protein [Pseudomonadales bacterium]